MRVLKEFVSSFDFVRMKPGRSVVEAPERLAVQALVETGRQYAVYLHVPVGKDAPARAASRTAEVGLDLPAGHYCVDWVDPTTGTQVRGENLEHTGGRKSLTTPAFDEDVALAIRVR